MTRKKNLRSVSLSVLAGIAASLLPAAEAAWAASRENTVIYGDAGQVNTLDPIRVGSLAVLDTVARVYSGLVTYDKDYNVVGDLATEYKIADDGKSIAFTLRDATFHDGSKVRAQDVAYTLDRVKRLGIEVAALIPQFESVEVHDDMHLTVHLNEPSSLFMGALTRIFIVNSALVAKNAGSDDGQTWLGTNDAGSGPYTLASFDGNNVELAWSDKYWMPRGSRPEAMMLRRIAEGSTRRDEMITGNIDTGFSFNQRDLAVLEKVPNLSVSLGPKNRLVGIYFNVQKGPTSDPRVRQAIRLAYDYAGAFQGIHLGYGALPDGPLPPALSCRPSLPTVAQDIEKAKALLAEAGQENLVLTLNFQPAFDEQVQMATLLQSNLQDIGVTLNLEPITFPNYLERLKNADQIPQMMLISENARSPDPGSFLSQTYMTGKVGTNRSGYSNPEVDALLADALTNPDPAKRCDIYKQVQTIIDKDAAMMGMYLPVVALVYRSDRMPDPQVDVPSLYYVPLPFNLKTE